MKLHKEKEQERESTIKALQYVSNLILQAFICISFILV